MKYVFWMLCTAVKTNSSFEKDYTVTFFWHFTHCTFNVNFKPLCFFSVAKMDNWIDLREKLPTYYTVIG